MYDEFPECANCGNDNPTDKAICRKCQLELNGEIGKRAAEQYCSAQGEADELAEVMAERAAKVRAFEPSFIEYDDAEEALKPLTPEQRAAADAAWPMAFNVGEMMSNPLTW